MGNMGPAAVPLLSAALKRSQHDRQDVLQIAMIEALGRIHDPNAIKALTGVLSVCESPFANSAADALEKIGKPAVGPMLFALRSRETAACYATYRFFIARGEPASEDALIEALGRYGNDRVAAELIKCGNARLENAATAWAKSHGYEITDAEPRPWEPSTRVSRRTWGRP